MRSTIPIIAFFVAIGLIGIAGYLAYDAMSKPLTARATTPEKTTKTKKHKKKPKLEADESENWGKPPALAGQPIVAGKPLAAGKPIDRSGSVAARQVSSTSGPMMHSPAASGMPFISGSLSQVRSQTDHLSNEAATDRVGWEIVDALGDRPTLAIWLFDRTASAGGQRASVVRRLGEVLRGFDQMKKQGHKAFENESNGPPLLHVVAAFGKSCEILTPEPTDDTEALVQALGKITEESDGAEMTFAAVQNILDEFLKYRTEKKRLIMLTVITDERGDDPEKVDTVVPIMEKYAIPCYVIGSPAPFGHEGSLAGAGAREGGKLIQVGPESMAKEMIDLDFPSHMGGGFRGGNNQMAQHAEMIDSGFGAFALSRLAKLSGGSYLIVRGGFGEFGGGGAKRFDAKVMARYAPDYVTKKEYDALLSENKCRMALHNASKLDPVEVNKDVSLTLQFVRQDEAKLKVSCDVAQRSVARIEPKLRPLYEALRPGESDRGKLSGARWQAAYDVAMGRVLAAKARFEGYNTMVAQLKQGKRPGGANDNQWIIVPAEGFPGDSSIDKMCKQSRKYLERVVKEHPGTPWEMMAT